MDMRAPKQLTASIQSKIPIKQRGLQFLHRLARAMCAELHNLPHQNPATIPPFIDVSICVQVSCFVDAHCGRRIALWLGMTIRKLSQIALLAITLTVPSTKAVWGQ